MANPEWDNYRAPDPTPPPEPEDAPHDHGKTLSDTLEILGEALDLCATAYREIGPNALDQAVYPGLVSAYAQIVQAMVAVDHPRFGTQVETRYDEAFFARPIMGPLNFDSPENSEG